MARGGRSPSEFMRTLTFNRVVGTGAMGTVYHAELRVPGGFTRTCAVKVMKEQGPDHEHFVTRMRDEARLLGMLNDEAILGVSELLQVEGRDAVVMEFVDGADLWETTRRHPVPPRALAELGAEVAGTLHRAHTAKHPRTKKFLNVVHRDVKPANIMVTSRGSVRLLDFGVARAAFASRESETQGLVLGTLNYFPPEVLAGEEPTRAVDLYGLGLSLWECATGKEWGPPQVSRNRVEKRVRQRMSELGEEYGPLIPILERLIAYQAVERPSGQQAERLLATVADELSGKGLRAWAREAVPSTQSGRSPVSQDDPLVGRTIRVDAATPDEEATVLAMVTEDVQAAVREAAQRRPATPPPPPPPPPPNLSYATPISAPPKTEAPPKPSASPSQAPAESAKGGKGTMFAAVAAGFILVLGFGALALAIVLAIVVVTQ
ncbi:MAG: serine/threonine protein kinase [Deltaproteobacteria bacterium]|nr:MAG: serine/threonine protein kinase [Deltaproteobacteria bacterium]